MALTGRDDGPPLLAPGPLAAFARERVEALARLSMRPLCDLDGAALLGERAAISGLSRRGAIAPGGSCRLVRASDGWIALNLARPDDVDLLPAWLGEGDAGDPWAFVAERIAGGSARGSVSRARLLGLAAAVADDPPVDAPPAVRLESLGAHSDRAPSDSPLVVDLSALWAGPLCAHLLGLTGARVVKVESPRRPDGARSGPRAFYDLLNAGKQSVALDFSATRDLDRLRRLLERADVVIESARPRALAQLGIDARETVASVSGLTWVSITGYGRGEPGAGWVAFGDDAAVAAGLAVATRSREAPLFCGDAIADPLAGTCAASAALESFQRGGGELLDVSLRDVTAHALLQTDAREGACVRRAGAGFEVVAGESHEPVAPPRARRPRGHARELGADTEAVLGELGC